MWTHFNVNDYVKVRLTDYGRNAHRRAHELLLGNLRPGARDEFPYVPPDEDEDGWSKWQLWSLMNTFGPHIWMTGEQPFATGIQFETKASD